jgi:hypothetical protein
MGHYSLLLLLPCEITARTFYQAIESRQGPCHDVAAVHATSKLYFYMANKAIVSRFSVPDPKYRVRASELLTPEPAQRTR